MRIISLAAIALLTIGFAPARDREEPITYVEGTLEGVIPNSGGSLSLEDAQALELKTGLAIIAVPYASITSADLGAIRKHSESEPLYKVWSLHKRIIGKPDTQLLKLEFKNPEGEQKSITVEMAKSAAPAVIEAIQQRKAAGNSNVARGNWWGDRYWKTTRNTAAIQTPAK